MNSCLGSSWSIEIGRVLFYCPDHGFEIECHNLTGLSISHVRRPGLSSLALGLASKALNKSSGLVYPYLSNQWSQSKV